MTPSLIYIKPTLRGGKTWDIFHQSIDVGFLYYSAWGSGDPHITTLDGLKYTFNGLGEYKMIETNDKTFVMQARTVKAKDENGTETSATVYAAFAAQDNDTDVAQIEMNEERTGKYFIFSLLFLFSTILVYFCTVYSFVSCISKYTNYISYFHPFIIYIFSLDHKFYFLPFLL